MNFKIRNRLVWAFLGLAVVNSPWAELPAAPPGREGLPPGLQKKDKLPPGWQKKTGGTGGSETGGASATASTNTPTSAPAAKAPAAPVTKTPEPVNPVGSTSGTVGTRTPPVTTPVTTTPADRPSVEEAKTTSTASTKPLTRAQRENQLRLERVLSDLEHQAARPGASERLLQRLSNRQKIPLPTLQSQLKAHPSLTVPQLYVATVISREGRVSLEQVLQSQKAGRSWAEIAWAHKVPVGDLASWLRSAEEAARESANAEQRRQ